MSTGVFLYYRRQSDVLTKYGETKQPWLERLGDKAEFYGFDSGREPIVRIPVAFWEEVKDKVSTKGLWRIQGHFNLVEHFAFGVWPFDNRIVSGKKAEDGV